MAAVGKADGTVVEVTAGVVRAVEAAEAVGS